MTQGELLATKLVTQTELEEIFDRAAKNPHQRQSYLDLCLQSPPDTSAAQDEGQSEPALTVRATNESSSMKNTQTGGRCFYDDETCILS